MKRFLCGLLVILQLSSVAQAAPRCEQVLDLVATDLGANRDLNLNDYVGKEMTFHDAIELLLHGLSQNTRNEIHQILRTVKVKQFQPNWRQKQASVSEYRWHMHYVGLNAHTLYWAKVKPQSEAEVVAVGLNLAHMIFEIQHRQIEAQWGLFNVTRAPVFHKQFRAYYDHYVEFRQQYLNVMKGLIENPDSIAGALEKMKIKGWKAMIMHYGTQAMTITAGDHANFLRLLVRARQGKDSIFLNHAHSFNLMSMGHWGIYKFGTLTEYTFYFALLFAISVINQGQKKYDDLIAGEYKEGLAELKKVREKVHDLIRKALTDPRENLSDEERKFLEDMQTETAPKQ